MSRTAVRPAAKAPRPGRPQPHATTTGPTERPRRAVFSSGRLSDYSWTLPGSRVLPASRYPGSARRTGHLSWLPPWSVCPRPSHRPWCAGDGAVELPEDVGLVTEVSNALQFPPSGPIRPPLRSRRPQQPRSQQTPHATPKGLQSINSVRRSLRTSRPYPGCPHARAVFSSGSSRNRPDRPSRRCCLPRPDPHVPNTSPKSPAPPRGQPRPSRRPT